MYLKFIVIGELIEIVKLIWPNAKENDLQRDYENKYEWVWLTIPELGICLNISREHEWGKESKTYPIYLNNWQNPYENRIDHIPEDIIERVSKALKCSVEVFSNSNIPGEEDAEPQRVVLIKPEI